jgi:hypothetical protein
MRNNSEGRELPPLPYPQIPGLEVSEPATPYQQLVAHLDFQAAVRQVPSRPVVQMDAAQVEARLAAFRAQHPDIVAFWRDNGPRIGGVVTEWPSPAGRQRGAAALVLLVLVCLVGLGAVMYFGSKQDDKIADEIKSCIDAGGEPIVRGVAVRCAIRPMVRS